MSILKLTKLASKSSDRPILKSVEWATILKSQDVNSVADALLLKPSVFFNFIRRIGID